jgi:hypothetical protein
VAYLLWTLDVEPLNPVCGHIRIFPDNLAMPLTSEWVREDELNLLHLVLPVGKQGVLQDLFRTSAVEAPLPAA